MQYTILLGVTILYFLAVAFYIRNLGDYFLYEFRNVLIAATLPFSLGLAVTLLKEFPGRENFSLAALLLSFPAGYANLSIFFMSILAVAMAISNVALIRHEGMAIKNTIGTGLQLAWILTTILVYVLMCVMHARIGNATGLGKFLCCFVPYFLYCVIDYGECMMIGMMIMGYVAASGKSAYDKDFIIIPGCSIAKDGGLLPLLKGRVNRALRYAWEQEIATGKPVHFVPSGGQGPDEVISEGSAMELYLLSHSVENYEVFPEKQSRNTEENFRFSARIIKEEKPDAKVAFATTNYHVLRCGMLAKRAGIPAEGVGSRTKWYFWPNGFAREVFAITNMNRRYHVAAVLAIFTVTVLVSIRIGAMY